MSRNKGQDLEVYESLSTKCSITEEQVVVPLPNLVTYSNARLAKYRDLCY